MAEAVSRRSVTTETLVRFLFSPCEICSSLIGTRTGFLSRVLLFSPGITPPVLHTRLHPHTALTRTHRQGLETLQKNNAFFFSEIERALDRKVLSLFFKVLTR